MKNRPKAILTPEGKLKLEAELSSLRASRPQIVAEVQRARALGDLKENGAYQANKDKMRQTDRRITYLELYLRNSIVVEKTDSQAVQLGSRLEVQLNGHRREFVVVGDSEADPKASKISLNSPLGKAFLNRSKNEQVTVQTPLGPQVYKILNIS